MAIANIYKWYIQTSSLGGSPIEVFPVTDNLQYSFEKGSISRDLVKNVSSEVILHKSDYAIIKALDDPGNCDPINLYIDVYCGGAWVRDFEGLIKLRKSVFNTYQCTVKLGIESNDVSRCAENIASNKVNILINSTKHVVKSLEGFVESISCGFTPYTNILIDYNNQPTDTSCIIAGQGWTVLSNKVTLITNGATSGRYNCEILTEWVRQRVNGGVMPSGSGWISLGADWVRPLVVVQDTNLSSGDYTNPLASDIYDIKKTAALTGTTINAIDNGMKIGDVLNLLVNQAPNPCNYTIISDFFGINADNTHPSNSYYTAALDFCQNIILFKNADIKRPYAQINSSIMDVTLSEFLTDLKNTFNIEATIYTQSGTNYFRVEHASYFTDTNGTDISSNYNITKGNEYTYDGDKLPSQEEFKFQVDSTIVLNNFDSAPIIYPANCSDNKPAPTNRCQYFVTNLGEMLDNENYPDTGLSLAATFISGGSLYFITDVEMNDRLTMPNLIDKFLSYNRPFSSGTISGVSKTFVQKRVKREQLEYCFVSACDIHNINTRNLIKSNLGWGEVSKMSYDAKNCTITAELLH